MNPSYPPLAPLPPPVPPPLRTPSLPPSQPPPPPAKGGPRTAVVIASIVSAVVALAVIAGVVLLAMHRGGLASGLDERAIVRVVVPHGRGTGFFVKAPPGIDGVLVVTAFHVIDSGDPVTIERLVPTSDKSSYLQAYPETEILAFDADSDVAILRVKELPASLVGTLDLVLDTPKDTPIISAGFPASSLTSRAGLLKKEGKLLEQVKLAVTDRAYGTLVRENATPGILVSSDLEPGFSGGPTCDERGRVVGVNVLKDLRYRGQNGAVASEVVKSLIDRIKPYTRPTDREIEKFLRRVQDQYLLLPVGDRSKVPEHELIALSELPQLHTLISELHRMESDTSEHELEPGVKATGRALLGMLLARLPGNSLETYSASSTQDLVRKCEDGARGIRRFFGDLEDTPSADPKDCTRLATRPLAWDLAAVTLEWGGAARDYRVTQVEEVDKDSRVFRASVQMGGVTSLVPVHLAWEAGVLRLKLFDKHGRLYALEGSRSAVGRDFEGKWVARKDRQPDPSIHGADITSEETLSITIEGTDKVTLSSEFKSQRTTSEKHALFACNHEGSVETAGTETLTGRLHNGVITGSSSRFELSSDGCARCGLCRPSNKLWVAKLSNGKLLLFGTAGATKPAPIEFSRP